MSLTAPTNLQKNHNNELWEGIRKHTHLLLETGSPGPSNKNYFQPFLKTSPQVFQTVFNIYKNVSNPVLEALSTRHENKQEILKVYSNKFPRLRPRTTEPTRHLGMENHNHGDTIYYPYPCLAGPPKNASHEQNFNENKSNNYLCDLVDNMNAIPSNASLE